MQVPKLQVLAIVGVAGVLASPAAAQSTVAEPSHFARSGTLPDRGAESSGVAVSRRHPELLWTHNDSGGEPVIYLTNFEGDDLGAFRVRGAENVDWEDIAQGPCPEASGSCGGPRDVEAMAVTPDGEVHLISKGREGAVIHYRLPNDWRQRSSVTAVALDTLRVIAPTELGRQVTGAVVAPDGHLIAVRTYLEIRFFYLTATGTLRSAGPSCWLGPREPQGEGIDFLSATTVVLTSESRLGVSGTISTVRCPLNPVRTP